MSVNQAELRSFLEEMHHSDMVRGTFMVFDNVLRGFTMSEINHFSRNTATKDIITNVKLKTASISGGMVHLAKYNGADETYLIVGNIINQINTSTGYVLGDLIDFVLDENYFIEKDFGEDFDGEVISEGVAIFNWTKIVACLKNEKLLQSSLIKISETLCKHQSFLLEYGNVNGFLGLGEGVLENDHYTDKNLELLFGEFIRFVDKNIAPKLNTNLPA